jgi:hypothetical protein
VKAPGSGSEMSRVPANAVPLAIPMVINAMKILLQLFLFISFLPVTSTKLTPLFQGKI